MSGHCGLTDPPEESQAVLSRKSAWRPTSRVRVQPVHHGGHIPYLPLPDLKWSVETESNGARYRALTILSNKCQHPESPTTIEQHTEQEEAIASPGWKGWEEGFFLTEQSCNPRRGGYLARELVAGRILLLLKTKV